MIFVVHKMANLKLPQNKTWELSLYELNRQPQEAVTDNREIVISHRSLYSELMCPICLSMLNKTMTTMECLHRFCSECIVTALRSGNKECPTCRKKLVSKRSLRADPNFDALISKIYNSLEEFEAQQERRLAKLTKSHSQGSMVHSINEGIKLQSQNRQQKTAKRKHHDGEGGRFDSASGQQNFSTPNDASLPGTEGNNLESSSSTNAAETNRQTSNPSSVRSTPSPVPSNFSSGTGNKLKRSRSILTSERSEESESNSEMDYSRTEGNDSNIDTEGESNIELSINDEIELVFKPHPVEMPADHPLVKALKENCVRYLKTTANATGKLCLV